MLRLTGARVVTAGGVLDPGWIDVAGGLVTGVGEGRLPRGGDAHRPDRVEDLAGAWVLPGFVDLHVHGGGGHDVAGTADEALAAVRFHRAHGTTSTLLSLVSAPVDALAAQLRRVAALTRAGEVLGAHLEGPFLAPSRRGAHDPAHLLVPAPGVLDPVLDRLLAAADGCLRVMTHAPELPGADALRARLLAAGVVAAVGHTDASHAEAAAAFAGGASLATHLFNGMRPLHHREPGAAGAALDAGVACEVVNDGVHVHPVLLRLVAGTPVGGAGDRLVLVTDAISAAGTGDGRVDLGGLDVEVRDGRARLLTGPLAGSLAGSTLTMDAAVRRAVHEGGLPVPVAAAAAATTPARVLGLGDRGRIAPGLRADLVVLDADLALVAVARGGRWLVRR